MADVSSPRRSAAVAAVSRALDRLFGPKRRTGEDSALFDRGKCAVEGCDRRPMRGSRFCGCCLEDRRQGLVIVFRGGEILPEAAELGRHPWLQPGDMGWHRPAR